MTATLPQQDLEFLVQLDKKVHKVQEGTYRPNMGGKPFQIAYDTYDYDKYLTKKDVSKLADIIKKHNLTLEPINTAMGFQVGFKVYSEEPITPGIAPEITNYLIFCERQLPKGEDFETMRKKFEKKEQPWKERYAYDY